MILFDKQPLRFYFLRKKQEDFFYNWDILFYIFSEDYNIPYKKVEFEWYPFFLLPYIMPTKYKHGRKKIGGVDRIVIRDSDFKYTTDPERILFTKHAYNLGPHLIDIPKKIPWETYKNSGTTTFIIEVPEEDAKFTGHISDGNRQFKELTFESKCRKEQYFFFGGCCYEILNETGYGLGGVRDFVDPTGDVDVRVSLPQIQIDEQVEGFTNPDGTLNSYVTHFSDWLFHHVSKCIKEIPAVYFANSAGPFETHLEGGVLLKEEILSHGKLVQILVRDMLKTQLQCNFGAVDHVIEFVILLEYHNVKRNLLHLNGSYLEDFHSLMRGNFSAMKERYTLVDEVIKHKWYNHVQRLKYLNFKFPFLKDKIDVKMLANDVLLLCCFIVLFSDSIMKYFAVGETSVKEVIEALVGNFLREVKNNEQRPLAKINGRYVGPDIPYFPTVRDLNQMPQFEQSMRTIKNYNDLFQKIDMLIERNADPSGGKRTKRRHIRKLSRKFSRGK